MPESAAEWYARVAGAIQTDGHREIEWPGWPTWPFEGPLGAPRPLAAPSEEQPRRGEGGVGCAQCEKSGSPDYIVWRDEIAMIGVPFEEVSLPVTAFLMPRRHADLSDLTDVESARMGQLMTYVERAASEVLDVPRLQVLRYGDGAEHLHWWLMARPTGMAQLRGSFLPLWDDLLPPRDKADLRADLDLVAARLVEIAGGEVLR